MRALVECGHRRSRAGARRATADRDDRRSRRRRDACAPIRAQAPRRRCGTCVENASQLFSGRHAPSRSRARDGGADRSSRCSTKGRAFPTEDLAARVRALLPRGQVARARPGRHRPRPRDREAPRGAARRRQCAPANRPEGGALFTVTLPAVSGCAASTAPCYVASRDDDAVEASTV